MIFLGGIEINKNMFLDGNVNSKNISYQQKRAIDGNSNLTSKTLDGGRIFTLGSTSLNNAYQGIWLQKDIEELKALEKENNRLVFEYYGASYNVKIVDTTGFQQLFQWEESGPCKKYIGSIILIEV